jgi:NAD(P)-dependent dehydrogenase (short-subunit alcohol dehydrogenase family)
MGQEVEHVLIRPGKASAAAKGSDVSASTTDTAGLLEGRVAVVSGVGPGMGRAIALELARAGADVALAARREASLRAVAAEVEALGRRAVCITTDLHEPEQCHSLAERTAAELGRIDVLVNNAFAEEDWHEPFDGFDPVRWREPAAVNVFGTLALSQACIPHLRAAGGGSIVMITTLSVRNPVPLLAGYSASKRALTTAAQVLAKELGPHKIRVNCVAPGHIRGRTLEEYFAWIAEQRGIAADDVAAEVAAMNPLDYLPTPEEIAPAVLFFASDLSRVITGQSLDVNCGRTMN